MTAQQRKETRWVLGLLAGLSALAVGVAVALLPPTVPMATAPLPPDSSLWPHTKIEGVQPPATQPQPSSRLSLYIDVYLRAEAVICPEADVLDAYMHGQRVGGAEEGHRAVDRMFRHPGDDDECVRTIKRDLVDVLDKTASGDRLVKIKWAGMRYLARPGDLSN
jgi:hypothetical protein